MQTIKGLCPWRLIEFKMPKEKVRRARMTIKKAKVKTPRAKERKEKEIKKKVIARAKVKAKTRRQRCGNMLHLWNARPSC